MRSILISLLAFFVLPCCAVAQETEADLRARLVDKPLYLRGQFGEDKLAFDAAGQLAKPVAPVTFTLAGVDIRSVELTSKELVLGGQRVGLEFEKDVPRRVDLVVSSKSGATSPEEMTIRIERPADGDFTVALDKIFVDGVENLVPQLPPCWQTFSQKHLLPSSSSLAPVSGPASGVAGTEQPAGTAKLVELAEGLPSRGC